ncbi:hypothetical protein [Aquimarina algicola]|uniref:Phage tail collar domain-containing protein n=1 Tax=Aquimarina algicola TaxID=2589995 RepID=A0A504J3X3_9FLAO|nr:hypothetical protein [Aquimarina algicola]TPN85144.1 hypothetical protein FHK87_14020 [Aquimarina algicola]
MDHLSTYDLLFTIQQRNLVYNYNFLYYSNKTGDSPLEFQHPDGWIYNDQGNDGEIGFDANMNACLIKKSKDDSLMTLSQMIHEFPRWKDLLINQQISASAIIQNHITPGFEVTFSISDGVSKSTKTIVFDSNETEEISIDIYISDEATKLEIAIESNTKDATIYIHKVFANIGKVALDTLPCMVEGFIGERKQYISTEIPPAEELSLCQESQELSTSYTRLSSFLNGRFGKGENDRSLLPDMRGYFSRVWDNGAKIDPDAANRSALGKSTIKGDHVGTVEEDEFKKHDHELSFDTNGTLAPGTSTPLPVISKTSISNTKTTGGLETRSKNITELYTIKWA